MQIALLSPQNSFISIIFYVIADKKKHGNTVYTFIESEKEFEEYKRKGYVLREDNSTKETDKPVKYIDKFTANFKQLTWKEQNIIYSQSIHQIVGADDKTIQEINPIIYQELKLKTVLKSWDVKDESTQQIIQITPEVIDNLPPEFARALLRSFEKIAEPTETEKKT